MCNPIIRAKLLNAADTEFNIVLGLCVGHDSLFMRYSDALCAVLVVKDTVAGHNPMGAINLYKKLEEKAFGKGWSVTVMMNKEI